MAMLVYRSVYIPSQGVSESANGAGRYTSAMVKVEDQQFCRRNMLHRHLASSFHQGTRSSGKNASSDGDLGGGFKYLLFSPLFGEDSHFD